MGFSWSIFIDLGIVSLALLVASFLRKQVAFFKNYHIPNSIIAGFILLPFYNFLAPQLGLDTDGLGNLVFHLLNLSFISMSLRKATGKTTSKGIFSMVVAILSQYCIQSLLGIGITFLFIATIIPNLFPSFGLMITLGFALGPGQAFAIGKGWEGYGFAGGGVVGLTFAAIGFLWACFAGVFIINRAKRKKWIDEKLINALNARSVQGDRRESWKGDQRKEELHTDGTNVITGSGAIDPLSYNLAVVFGVYLITFLLLKLLGFVLSFAGTMGEDLALNLWGISFIFAALMAALVKRIFALLKINLFTENQRLNRIAGTSVDFMVTASIAAISLVIVAQYWMPIIVMGILGGLITSFTLLWLSSRLFKDYVFQRTILLFGALTGTLPTGLALLRVLDPEFKTLAASDFMYAVGIVFIFAIPLILSMNFPAYGYTSGNSIYYWITFGIYLTGLIFVFIVFRIIVGKGAFRNPAMIWFKK
jgi:ESS family glutamate:Na+ symporter